MLANWCAAVHRLDTDKEKAQYDQKIYHTGLYVFFGSDGRVRSRFLKNQQIQRLALCDSALGPTMFTSKRYNQGDNLGSESMGSPCDQTL